MEGKNNIGTYKIPEKDIVRICIEKLEKEAEIFSRRDIYSHSIACMLMADSRELYDLNKRLGPLPLGSNGVHMGCGNTSLNDMIDEAITGMWQNDRMKGKGMFYYDHFHRLNHIVEFINDFIPLYDSRKLDEKLLEGLTKEQYEKINGREWKDWSWSSVFFGRIGIKYVHKTGLGPYNLRTRDEDIKEELKNARTKAKKSLKEMFYGPSSESVRVYEEGKRFIDYCNQIDYVIRNCIHYSNLRP